MATRGIILRKKIDGSVFDIFPYTLTSAVYDNDGRVLDEVIIELNNTYGSKVEFNKLKESFEKLTNGAADQYDTIKEIGDWIKKHNDAYEALLLAVDKKVEKLIMEKQYFKIDEIPDDYISDGIDLEVVDDSVLDEDLTDTQIRQSEIIAHIPTISVGDMVQLCTPKNFGVAGDILNMAADGGISDSGYTVGGAVLQEEASEKMIATEKAVRGGIDELASVQDIPVDELYEIAEDNIDLILSETMFWGYTRTSIVPYNLTSGAAVVLNDEIHVLGGSEGTGKEHYKWDGTEWTQVSTLPYKLEDGSAVVLNDEIHILGSYNAQRKHYKWDGTEWTQVSTLPYKFYEGAAVVLNGEIHIMGSNEGTGKQHYKWDGTEWTQVSTLPKAFGMGSAVVYNGEIHLLGGGFSNADCKKHHKWDGTEWTQVGTLPYAFDSGCSVVHEDKIRIIGGFTGRNDFSWDGVSWERNCKLKDQFTYGSAVVYRDKVHIFGYRAFKRHYRWDYITE